MIGSTALSANTWYHVLITSTFANATSGTNIYINNVAETISDDGASSDTTPTYVSDGKAYIGREDFTATNYGGELYIKNLAIWGAILDSNNRTAISNSGNYKSIPKISVQEKPVYDSEFWNEHNSDTTTPKDLSDLNGLVQTMDKSEIKLLCDERPELIADYILAVYSGYDLTDEKDCELYFDETKQPQYFDDTKPYGNTTTTKKGVNNAK